MPTILRNIAVLGFCLAGLESCQVAVDNSSLNTESNQNFYVNGYIEPVKYSTPSSNEMNVPIVVSSAYKVHFYVNADTNNVTKNAYGDATIKVNGQTIPYDTANKYYHDTLAGPFSAGDVFHISVKHVGMDAIEDSIAVPAATIPSTFNITPMLVLGQVTPPYEITPTTAWPLWGSVSLLLYDSTASLKSHYDLMTYSGTTGPIFSVENCEYGTNKVKAANAKFVGWAENRLEFDSYGWSGTASRIRVFATDGFVIGSTF